MHVVTIFQARNIVLEGDSKAVDASKNSYFYVNTTWLATSSIDVVLHHIIYHLKLFYLLVQHSKQTTRDPTRSSCYCANKPDMPSSCTR